MAQNYVNEITCACECYYYTAQLATLSIDRRNERESGGIGETQEPTAMRPCYLFNIILRSYNSAFFFLFLFWGTLRGPFFSRYYNEVSPLLSLPLPQSVGKAR